jgi:hypothetical protein
MPESLTVGQVVLLNFFKIQNSASALLLYLFRFNTIFDYASSFTTREEEFSCATL